MPGEEKIVVRGVTPIVGEQISIAEIVKGMKLKDGATLDYTTPMGLQIKARIEKGKPTDIKLFDQGTAVTPHPDIPEIAHQFPDWLEHCHIEWVWRFYVGSDGMIHLTRMPRIVCPKS